jgi:hypothetical protein
MFSFQGASIMNNGYYDVPINNQFSNVEYRDPAVKTNEYQLNKNINVTMNDNRDEYIVAQEPTHPSKSLYLESDKDATKYYGNDRAISLDSNIPLKKKKEQTNNDFNINNFSSFSVENFRGGGGGHGGGHGGGGYSGGHGGGGGYGGRGHGYYGGNSVVLGNGGHPYINRGYLNTQLMPNISRTYWGGVYPNYGYGYGYGDGYGYGNIYDYNVEYVPEYVPVIKEPPYNIIPKEEVKVELLSPKDNMEDKPIIIETEKPKKKKCNKIKNKELLSKQILWFIILILLFIIIVLLFKFYN